MSKTSVFFLALIVAILATTSAISDAERAGIIEYARPLLTSCSEELGISKEDILAARESKNVNALNPCYFSCFYKKIGVINDSGLFDIEAVKENNKKFLSSEEDRKTFLDIGNVCLSVNEATVSDGAKGCERAKLLVSCMIKEKSPFLPFYE